MKKVFCISGIFAVFFLSLLLTGWADTDDAAKTAIRQGNRYYESSDYKAALQSYEAGLAASPENKILNYNAAQTAYLLGEYEKAIEYYGNSEDCAEKFLNTGNICFRAGEAAQDQNQKAQFYTQALQIYLEGITKFPQDVPLKYNYEFVKNKLEELDMQQKGDGQSEDSQGEDSESAEGSDSQDGQEQNSENSEDTGEAQDQNAEQNETSGEQSEGQEGQEGDGEQQDSYSQEEGEGEPDGEAIERILQILETQEEQSLKNNQEVVGGKGDEYDW